MEASADFENTAFTAQTRQLEIPALNTLRTFRLPGNLLNIEEEAFAGLSVLAVIIPDGCTSIDSLAFANCEDLLYVRIPASVTWIAEDAFDGCGLALIHRLTE